MVKNLQLDYMHLICLGTTKKLLSAWVNGGFERAKLSKEVLDDLTANLIAIARFIPCYFPRKTWTLMTYPT